MSVSVSTVETERQCNDCGKVFANKKSSSKHKSRCRSRNKAPGLSSTSSPLTEHPSEKNNSSVETKKNSFNAYECDVCCRLFKSKESLIKHRGEHSDAEEEEEIIENLDFTESDVSDTDVEELENDSKFAVAREVVESLKRKISFLDEEQSREAFLKLKLAKIQSKLSEDKLKEVIKGKKIFISQKYKDKARNVSQISLQEEVLRLRLIKLKAFIEKKNVATPTETQTSLKVVKATKPGQRKKESNGNQLRKKVKISMSALGEREELPERKKMSMSAYKKLTEKSSKLSTLELKMSCLQSKLERVRQLVPSNIKEGEENIQENTEENIKENREENIQENTKENIKENTEGNTEENTEEIKTEPITPHKDEILASLEPEVIINEDAGESPPVVKPAKKFEVLKTKLEKQLARRSKIKSQLEKMIGQPQAAEEEAARRLEARLAREATVREVMRRQEERRQAERDKELRQQEEKLVAAIEELKREIQELAESLSPENCLKKRSRKELRKHLQGKVDPKPSLAMSLETRLKNILDLQEEKSALTQKLEELKQPKQAVVKIEESQDDVFDDGQVHAVKAESQVHNIEESEIKQELKDEPVVLEVDVSDSESDGEEDYSLLEHFVTDKEAYRQLIFRKTHSQPPKNQNQSNDDAEACDIIKVEVDIIQSYEDEDFVLEEEEEKKVDIDFLFVRVIIDQMLNSIVGDTDEKFIEEKKEEEEGKEDDNKEEKQEDTEEEWNNLQAITNLLDDVLLDVTSGDIVEVEDNSEAGGDILDQSWSQAGKLLRVLSEDESVEEEDMEDVLRTFQSGSLTRTALLQALPPLGWVSRDDQAEFLPPDWFMKMDTSTYLETGTPSFFFITENVDICLSSEDALRYMEEKGRYSKSEMVQFEQHFKM